LCLTGPSLPRVDGLEAVLKGYRFDRATHPQERLCWQMAAVAFERLRQTDIAGVAGE